MLKVTDDGVKIQLQSNETASPLLRQILLVAIVIAVVGGLMTVGILPTLWGAAIIILTIIGGYGWQFLPNKSSVTTLSGGELLLTPHALIHRQTGKTTQYQLTAQDSVHIAGDTIAIHNAQGKPLYQINGFSEPKHLEVAQAVLNGKTIKTQGKAIKMQSSEN